MVVNTLRLAVIVTLCTGSIHVASFAGDCGCCSPAVTTAPCDSCGIGVSTCDSCSVSCGAGCSSACGHGCSACGCNSCGSTPIANLLKSGNCGGCSSTCDSCCLQCCEQWQVVAGAWFANRTDPDPLTLATHQNTGQELLNAQDLDYGTQVATRIFLVRDHSNCQGLEVGYFGFDSMNGSTPAGGEISPSAAGPGLTFPSTAPHTIFAFDYGTSLHNAELNWRRRCNECVTWIAGFRWIELGDYIGLRQTSPVSNSIYQVDTDNHMYGFQLGANAELINCQGRFHIDGRFRAGVFYNNADQQTNAPILAGLSPTPFVTGVQAADNNTAFAGEIGLQAVYEINCRLSVTGGYQLLWLDGVALAPDQIPVTSMLAPGSAALDTGGTVLFHGATVGLVATF